MGYITPPKNCHKCNMPAFFFKYISLLIATLNIPVACYGIIFLITSRLQDYLNSLPELFRTNINRKYPADTSAACLKH